MLITSLLNGIKSWILAFRLILGCRIRLCSQKFQIFKIGARLWCLVLHLGPNYSKKNCQMLITWGGGGGVTPTEVYNCNHTFKLAWTLTYTANGMASLKLKWKIFFWLPKFFVSAMPCDTIFSLCIIVSKDSRSIVIAYKLNLWHYTKS